MNTTEKNFRFKINDEFPIAVYRQDSNFDRACDTAIKMANSEIGLDKDGNATHVKDWNLYYGQIQIEFQKYVATIGEHCYQFTAKITGIPLSDDDDDET